MKHTASGKRRHLVTVQQPATTGPDADGAFTTTYAPATPATWKVAIVAEPAALERQAPGTTITTAAHRVLGPYRADITTATQLVLGTRTFQVDGVRDPEERHRELDLLVRELV
jgi:head-tail adaptor